MNWFGLMLLYHSSGKPLFVEERALGLGAKELSRAAMSFCLNLLKPNLEKVTGDFYQAQNTDFLKKRHEFRQIGVV